MTQRWKIFSVLALPFIMGYFYRVSMAVLSRDITQDLHLSAAELGILSGIFFYIFALAQLPLGPLLDRFGGKRIICLFSIITTSGSLIFALAPTYQAALIGRALLGAGTASILMGSLKIFTNWFNGREFPRVSGLMIAVGNLGSVSATAPLALAIGVFSWRPVILAITLAQAVATILVFATVRDSPAGQENAAVVASSSPIVPENTRSILGTLYSSPDFWLTALIAFFWYANYMVLLALWGGPYLREAVGLSPALAGNTLLCTSVGLILGSLLLGKAIDLLNGSLEKTILCGQAFLLLLMLAMLGPAEHLPRPALAGLFFLIGLVSATGTIIYPLARKLVPHHFAATAMTGVNFFLLMGAATTQHVMGIYICSFPRGPAGYPAAAYHGAFFIPICGLAGTLALFILRNWVKGFGAEGFDGAAEKE
jgi:predicted MFS family arabinose efflux permease